MIGKAAEEKLTVGRKTVKLEKQIVLENKVEISLVGGVLNVC